MNELVRHITMVMTLSVIVDEEHLNKTVKAEAIIDII